eukprot:7211045-Pyramimonas_sp.AAC.1
MAAKMKSMSACVKSRAADDNSNKCAHRRRHAAAAAGSVGANLYSNDSSTSEFKASKYVA